MSTKKNNLPPMDSLTITVLGPDQSLLKPHVSTFTKKELDAQFKVIVSFFHYSGTRSDEISEKTLARIFELGNGYGSMDLDMICELDLMWDWSHIRDSTPEALEEIYSALMEAI